MVPRKAALAFVIATTAAWCAAAHPHVFAANRMTVQFENGVLKGMTFYWTFDPMFSAMILADFKPGADGTFGPKVIDDIRVNDFDNLENYHYFLAFTVGRQPVQKLHVEQFRPYVVDGDRLVYSFFVPLNLRSSTSVHTLSVVVYDDSYYVAFDPMRTSDVQLQGSVDMAVDLSVKKTKVEPLWPGQYMPDQLVIEYRQRP